MRGQVRSVGGTSTYCQILQVSKYKHISIMLAWADNMEEVLRQSRGTSGKIEMPIKSQCCKFRVNAYLQTLRHGCEKRILDSQGLGGDQMLSHDSGLSCIGGSKYVNG